MLYPKFFDSYDLSINITAVQTSGAQTFGSGIKVVRPLFENGRADDIAVGNDSPLVNGWINDVVIENPTINQYGLSANTRINVFSGIHILITDVIFNYDTSQGVSVPTAAVRLYDSATVTEFDDINISNIIGTYAGGSTRGVQVSNGLLTGTHAIKLDNINVGATAIFEGVTAQNTNYIKRSKGRYIPDTAFTASFTNQNSEINRVNKFAGKQIFSLSGGIVKPLYSTGADPTSSWVDGAGTVVHLPV